MKIVNQYIIPFKSLKNGEHSFSFTLDEEFCAEHEALNAKGGDISVEVLLNRKSTLLDIDIHYKGYINICCDRCSEYFDYTIDCNSNLIVKFKDQESETIDDIWILNTNETDLNLYQHFYDTLGVILPIKVTHPDDINGEPGCEIEYNNTNDDKDTGEEFIDPRWEKLKNLKTDNN